LEEKKTAIADVIWGSGIAVVYEPDGRVFLLEHDKPEPLDGNGVHLGMYLQPAMNNVVTVEAGEHPYADLHAEMRRIHKIGRALDCVLTSVDGKMSASLRRRFATHAAEFLKDDGVKTALTDIFTKQPLPVGTSFAGLPDELKAFLKKVHGQE
jgi:hypothetical protein